MENETGMVVWMTGLSGAGKSTLAERVSEELRAQRRPVEVLDGDALRESLSRGLGYTRPDRDAHVLRVAFVARLLAKHGVIAIVAAISPYRDARARARQLGGRFIEVHLAAPLSVCIRRDVKGLYARALHGEIPHFTGVSDPYEEPLNPELRINTGVVPLEEAARLVLAALQLP
jgi:adenylylsulfate kinase